MDRRLLFSSGPLVADGDSLSTVGSSKLPAYVQSRIPCPARACRSMFDNQPHVEMLVIPDLDVSQAISTWIALS